MLRDLDQRQQPHTGLAGPPDDPAVSMPYASSEARGASAARFSARHLNPVRAVWVLLAGVLFLGLAAGLWWTTTATRAPGALLTAPQAVVPTALPDLPTPLPVAEPATVVAVAGPTPLPTAPQALAPVTAKPQAVPSKPTQTARAAPSTAAPVSAPPASPPAPPQETAQAVSAPEEPGKPLRQVLAGREALAQAQALWGNGSHDAAVELLQQAVAVVQRPGSASPGAAHVALLADLARELARMLMSDGRVAAALDVLTPLETVLGKQADIWALRGNAAQRLGHYADSVQAYDTALRLRPNEQRWLLGAAVSLAASGQTARASEMADKAQALGPIGREVQAYLRQAGVPLN